MKTEDERNFDYEEVYQRVQKMFAKENKDFINDRLTKASKHPECTDFRKGANEICTMKMEYPRTKFLDALWRAFPFSKRKINTLEQEWICYGREKVEIYEQKVLVETRKDFNKHMNPLNLDNQLVQQVLKIGDKEKRPRMAVRGQIEGFYRLHCASESDLDKWLQQMSVLNQEEALTLRECVAACEPSVKVSNK